MDSTAQFMSVFGWIIGIILAYIICRVMVYVITKQNKKELWEDFSRDSEIYNPNDWR